MSNRDTKGKIIDAAREIFASRGFQGSTIAEIAKKAGISEGAIYRHFNSKDELLMQCVEPVLQDILDNMESEIPDVDNLHELIKSNLEMRLRLFRQHYSTFKILMNELPYSKEMMDQYMQFLSAQEQKISQVMNKVKDLGKLQKTRNYLLFGLGQAMSLWLYTNFQEWADHGNLDVVDELLDIDDSNVIEDLTDYIMYGIAGAGSSSSGSYEKNQ